MDAREIAMRDIMEEKAENARLERERLEQLRERRSILKRNARISRNIYSSRGNDQPSPGKYEQFFGRAQTPDVRQVRCSVRDKRGFN